MMFLWQLHTVAEWTQAPLLYIATLAEDGMGDAILLFLKAESYRCKMYSLQLHYRYYNFVQAYVDDLYKGDRETEYGL